MKQNAINILVADANVMVCELLSGAFKRCRLFKVSACANNLSEVIEAIKTTRIDVALVGAHLHDGSGSGLQAIREIRALQPKTRTVVLLERSEQNLVVEAFRNGAKGVFCRSEQHFDTLCKCVSRVNAGEIWANTAQLIPVMEVMASYNPLFIFDCMGTKLLTQCENKIVRLVTNGLTNREVASAMGLSEHTVKNYLFRVFDKLGVSSRVELVLYAMRVDEKKKDVDGSSGSQDKGGKLRTIKPRLPRGNTQSNNSRNETVAPSAPQSFTSSRTAS